MADDQIDIILNGVRVILGEDVVGAYLHGSAVLGGLRPLSDLDVLVVLRRPTTRSDKQQLVSRLLEVSGRPRFVELTMVVEEEIHPWRYPPRMDFQYGDWWRSEFERGELEPWPSAMNPDIALLVRMVLLGDRPLLGPPPTEVFDRVPRADYVGALVEGVDGLLQTVESDTRNVVLTLARIWNGVATDHVCSKDAAAEWALPLLPAKHRRVLARARAIYLGDQEERWDDVRGEARSYAGFVAEEIDRRSSPQRMT